MELFGKVVSPKKALDLNSSPEITVNSNSGRLSFSKGVTNKLGTGLFVGFGYDPANSSTYLYLMDAETGGVPVGKQNSATNKFHSVKLAEAFANDIDESVRFRLTVDLENTTDHEGTTLYPLTFKEVLEVQTRTVKVEETEDENPIAHDFTNDNDDTAEVASLEPVSENGQEDY